MHSSANGLIACRTDHSNTSWSGPFCTLIETLMSASVTMEVANTTAITQMEVTHVPAIMGTDLTVMDIFVKV